MPQPSSTTPRRRTPWVLGGVAILGLFLVVGSMAWGASTGNTESLFADTPSGDELAELGRFEPQPVGGTGTTETAVEETGADDATASDSSPGVETADAAPATEGPSEDADAISGGGADEAAPGDTSVSETPEAGQESSPQQGTEAPEEEPVVSFLDDGVDTNADSTTPTIGGNVSGFSSGDIFGLLWRLALVVAIIWASIYVLRRFATRSQKVQSESGALKVLETVGLASDRLVYLLEAGDRVLVVGSTPNHIALLAELDDPDIVSSLRHDADRTSPRVATLGGMMRDFGGTVSRFRSAPERTAAPAGDFAGDDLTPIMQQLLRAQSAVEASGANLPQEPDLDEARREAE
ncbi:MAG TPA: flagellar biosynthetic protein FliO [Dehalococcoidia bacterium]|nr:flagellar biosynthetic protein FliO [Dehalococcoidia bacterium]